MSPFTARLLVGLLTSSVVAGAALRVRALAPGGAVAAVIVGTLAVLGGTEWVVLLLFFFVSSTALSRLGASEKERRVGDIVAKGGQRDVAQVLANGGAFALAAAGAAFGGQTAWSALGIGAIAAATADTWSTELGTLWGGTPRHILRWTPIPRGLSGGITLPGSAGALAGALLTAALARAVHWDTAWFAITAGGVAGAFADSLLGAMVQERRWCESCGAATERAVHRCGTATTVRGGVRGFNNDAVNLTSTVLGALTTWLLS